MGSERGQDIHPVLCFKALIVLFAGFNRILSDLISIVHVC